MDIIRSYLGLLWECGEGFCLGAFWLLGPLLCIAFIKSRNGVLVVLGLIGFLFYGYELLVNLNVVLAMIIAGPLVVASLAVGGLKDLLK